MKTRSANVLVVFVGVLLALLTTLPSSTAFSSLSRKVSSSRDSISVRRQLQNNNKALISSTPQSSSLRPSCFTTTKLMMAGDDSSSNSEGTTTKLYYPRMSKEEITKWMNDIPVYAITSKAALGGIVVLNDKTNAAGGVSYYFLSKDMAQTTLSLMRQNTDNREISRNNDWQITPFSLGMIWFEVLYNEEKQDKDEIVHRLVADNRNLAAARQHIEQYATESDGTMDKKFLPNGFNEIPVFMDLQMRIFDAKGSERFPMYLNVKDMVGMCQDFMKNNDPDYKAAVNIADLYTLVNQMMEEKESTVNFRETLLIAPSDNEENPIKGGKPTNLGDDEEEEPEVPSMMNTDW